MQLDSFEDILSDVRAGKPIVLVDDQDRENEGDLMVAGSQASAEVISFMMNDGKGLICISMTEERRRTLSIPLQVRQNSSVFGTNFAVSFDHRSAAGNGVTAEARAGTIRAVADLKSTADDFMMPGYVFPVCSVPGGVLKRRGQTEGSVDLSRLAGLPPVGVICEIMGADGEMLRGEALQRFCRLHSLRITSVQEIVEYRLKNEVAIRRVAELELPAARGLGRSAELDSLYLRHADPVFRLIVYNDDVDDKEHFALVKGQAADGMLVRVHSECLTGDVFESRRCDCGQQFDSALAAIIESGQGVLIYLYQEGRGIGLGNKLRAYELQDRGLDTVDANLELGFEADERDYRVAAHILSELGIRRVRLMTNNPDKLESLGQFGIEIAERIPLDVSHDPYSAHYLATKKKRLGHLLNS